MPAQSAANSLQDLQFDIDNRVIDGYAAELGLGRLPRIENLPLRVGAMREVEQDPVTGRVLELVRPGLPLDIERAAEAIRTEWCDLEPGLARLCTGAAPGAQHHCRYD